MDDRVDDGDAGSRPQSAGVQHELALTGGPTSVRAVVSAVGASPRVLTVDGVDLVESYSPRRPPPMAAGVVLVPWPNRVDGGRWHLGAVEQQLEINEAHLGHAIHGLLRDTSYEVAERDNDRITLAATVEPAPGYPFRLDTRVHYRVVPDGLAVRHEIRNTGPATAPVALGTHPYLRVGDVPAGELTVTLPAARALSLDERNIPTGAFDVDGTSYDLRGGAPVRDAVRHASFGALDVVDGEITHTLSAPDGRALDVVAEPDFGYVHFFVTDDFPTERGPTTAVAIEPMTAPPDALRSGEAVRWLAPGETWSLGWRLRLRNG
ncbi:aldose 1-epimerase [Haloactinopolyspora alba]|uniref:Aldose 1-epimerase n=1 Tax=Haloactinopolyspora alba TaxID=648780 RepID=A0A2P8DZX5_9ACTN|nr:aldose 1-epimerase family protein [Haloactinopolyspora alba]PSL02778.1 aldose 1-epimerase [Haloactinopolyspora alba]